jgi:hypothetical protein
MEACIMSEIRLNTKETVANIKKYLYENICPLHYAVAEKELAVLDSYGKKYSDKTNRKEKVRQLFSEHDNNVIVYNGYFYLRDWFRGCQRNLIEPTNIICPRISFNLAFDAGYELAERKEYLKDWQKNKNTGYWYKNRRTGYLVEYTVREYFRKEYSEFYIEPSNKNDYRIPAVDDFSLRILDRTIIVDVKQENEIGLRCIRNPKKNVVYIFARWRDNIQTATIIGMTTGSDVISKNIGLNNIDNNILLPVEMLFAILNMARTGIDYWELKEGLMERGILWSRQDTE